MYIYYDIIIIHFIHLLSAFKKIKISCAKYTHISCTLYKRDFQKCCEKSKLIVISKREIFLGTTEKVSSLFRSSLTDANEITYWSILFQCVRVFVCLWPGVLTLKIAHATPTNQIKVRKSWYGMVWVYHNIRVFIKTMFSYVYNLLKH